MSLICTTYTANLVKSFVGFLLFFLNPVQFGVAVYKLWFGSYFFKSWRDVWLIKRLEKLFLIQAILYQVCDSKQGVFSLKIPAIHERMERFISWTASSEASVALSHNVDGKNSEYTKKSRPKPRDENRRHMLRAKLGSPGHQHSVFTRRPWTTLETEAKTLIFVVLYHCLHHSA